jgi:hypothetical protein
MMVRCYIVNTDIHVHRTFPFREVGGLEPRAEDLARAPSFSPFGKWEPTLAYPYARSFGSYLPIYLHDCLSGGMVGKRNCSASALLCGLRCPALFLCAAASGNWYERLKLYCVDTLEGETLRALL